jgi:hypothetical protein
MRTTFEIAAGMLQYRTEGSMPLGTLSVHARVVM